MLGTSNMMSLIGGTRMGENIELFWNAIGHRSGYWYHCKSREINYRGYDK